ncbi:MAG: hemerythrin family protein [Rhodocyclaceae bacterium]|jgi:hemerythrin|nr:hemerythrin family protein [Rhodocyclaceae bacterium]
MPVAWREALSVSNNLIDADHQHLLSLINSFEEIFTADRPIADLLAAIGELRDYTHTHFAREERMMLALRYARYDHHKLAHARLIEQLDQAAKPLRELGGVLAATAAALPEEIRDNLVGLLRQWLLEHIMGEDMQLKPLLGNQSKNFAP